jgi:hypothetical protein
MDAVFSFKTLVSTYRSAWHPNLADCSLLSSVKTENYTTRCLLFPATDVNDALDDDETDPEYNVLADEEQETGENLLLFCQWWIIPCNCDQSE